MTSENDVIKRMADIFVPRVQKIPVSKSSTQVDARKTRKNPMTGVGQMTRGGVGGAEVAIPAPTSAGLVLTAVSDGAGGYIEGWAPGAAGLAIESNDTVVGIA